MPSDCASSSRSAFTLIELLVVVVIIGILAAMAMAVMFSAQEAARRARTEGLISVLNSQMAYRWDSYRTRRIQTSVAYGQVHSFLTEVCAPNPPDVQRVAAMQLITRRQLMRIELPDRWWDVAFDDSDTTIWDSSLFIAPQSPITSKLGTVDPEPMYNGHVMFGPAFDQNGNGLFRFPNDQSNSLDPTKRQPPFPIPNFVSPTSAVPATDPRPDPFASVERIVPSWVNRTSLANAYMRRYQQVLRQTGAAPSSKFQGAECLYMILTTGMGDETSGGGTFNEQDFADTDDDGVPEFIDGWGQPIEFLRWAPGFRSDMQSGDPIKDHDPFDPRRVDAIAFRLFPLIYSGGPDGAFGDDGVNSPYGLEVNRLGPEESSDFVNLNDPYAPFKDGTNLVFRGHPRNENSGIGSSDNIFNHSLQVR